MYIYWSYLLHCWTFYKYLYTSATVWCIICITIGSFVSSSSTTPEISFCKGCQLRLAVNFECPIDPPSLRRQWCKDAILVVNGPGPMGTNAHCCQWAASSCCSNPSWAMHLAKPCTIYLRVPESIRNCGSELVPSAFHSTYVNIGFHMILDKSCWIDKAFKKSDV